jgi:hypothetical protein
MIHFLPGEKEKKAKERMTALNKNKKAANKISRSVFLQLMIMMMIWPSSNQCKVQFPQQRHTHTNQNQDLPNFTPQHPATPTRSSFFCPPPAPQPNAKCPHSLSLSRRTHSNKKTPHSRCDIPAVLSRNEEKEGEVKKKKKKKGNTKNSMLFFSLLHLLCTTPSL